MRAYSGSNTRNQPGYRLELAFYALASAAKKNAQQQFERRKEGGGGKASA